MKRLTLKCLIATLLIFCASNVKAQWAVFDANNFAQSTKLAAEAANQTKYLSESYAEIKKANDLLTKISSQLTNLSIISDIVQEQISLVGRATNTINNIRNHKNTNAKLVSQIQSNIDDIMVSNKSNIEFLKSFMKDGFSMSDGERLQLALEVRKQTKEREKDLQAIDARARVTFETLAVYKSLK